MGTISMKINVNADLQRNFQSFCDEINVTVEDIINKFMKKVVEEKKLPFENNTENDELSLYNEETKQAIKDAHNGINLSRPFTSVDELFKDLYADD